MRLEVPVQTLKIQFYARNNYLLFLNIYYSKLGCTSVHGVMAGYTDFSVGNVRDVQVMIPIEILASAGSKKMKRKDYEW